MSGGLVPAIPPNFRVPLAWFQIGAGSGGTQAQQRALLIGCSDLAQPAVEVYVADYKAAVALFGRRSMLARMVLRYRQNDPVGEIWCVPMPAAATPAGGSIAIGGAATAAGNLFLYVGGQLVTVAVAAGDAAATVLANLQAAIAAAPDLPITAAAPAAGATTLPVFAATLGAAGAGIDLRLNYLGAAAGQVLPPGLTVGLGPLAALGASPDPDPTAALAALGAVDYDFVVSGYSGGTALAALQGLMDDSGGRWSYLSGEYGHCFYPVLTTGNDPSAATAALLAFGATRDGQHMTAVAANDTPTPPWELVAATVGACVPSLRAQPNLPLQNLQVQGVLAPPQGSRFSTSERQSLLSVGVGLLKFDRAGNAYVDRLVTNYQTNAQGVPDQSYLDTETLYSLMAFIRGCNARVSAKYSRSLLADNGTKFGAGIPTVTPNIVKQELVAYHAECERTGLTEDTDAFAAALVVQRSAQDPTRLDAVLDPNLVGGLRIFAALVNFNLNTVTS